MKREIIFYSTLALFSLIFAPVQAELFVYSDKATGLLGFKDVSNNIVIPAQFSHVMVPHDQKLFSPEDKDTQFLVPVAKEGTIWRMTSNGTLKFETVFFDNGPDYYEEGLSRFIKGGKVGFHDREGNIVIPPSYDFATPFREGYSYVCNGCYSEYPSMPTYQPLSASFCQHPREDTYKSIIGGKWGIIDKKGHIIVPLNYESFEEAAEKVKL